MICLSSFTFQQGFKLCMASANSFEIWIDIFKCSVFLDFSLVIGLLFASLTPVSTTFYWISVVVETLFASNKTKLVSTS